MGILVGNCIPPGVGSRGPTTVGEPGTMGIRTILGAPMTTVGVVGTVGSEMMGAEEGKGRGAFVGTGM